MSVGRLITLWHEQRGGNLIGHAVLVWYPEVGDVVRDAEGHDWLVTGRRWHHDGGLVLLCREAACA